MSLYYPWALAIIPICAILIALSFRHARSWSTRAGLAAACRLLAISCAAVAIAGPHVRHERPAESLLAFLDISSSVTTQQGEQLLTNARLLARALEVPLSVVPFAKSVALTPLATTSGDSFSAIRQNAESLDLGATDLEALISSPLTATAPVALILSDGYETTGAVRAGSSGSRQLALFPLTAPGESSDNTIAISQLHAPLTVKAQKSVDVRATITNSGQTAQAGTLEVTHGDRVILSKNVTIPAGNDLSLAAQSDPALEGLRTVQATFSWRDATGEHFSTRTIWLSGEKRDKVLLLSGSPEDDRFLSQILQSQSYQLRSETAQSLSGSLGEPNDYRVVVLNNIAAPQIPERFLFSLGRFVRSGGALVTIGGNQSYGLGRYIGSPLEEILPVRLVPPRQEKKRLNVAVSLVVDKSRSMATDSRLEFAKSAAGEVVRSLKDDDYIGVIGFDDVPFIALPMSQVSTVRDSALNRISRLYPTSRTNLFPALDEARRGLSSVNAGRKHVIILTDGKLPDPGPYYFELIKQMRFLGITVSTVMVGNDADDGFLAQMAQAGGGAFYQTDDPSNLPKVFLSDVRVATGERTLKEEPEIAVREGPDHGVSTTLTSFPPLRGFVQTLPRDSASTELVVSDSEGTYPLLASWPVGEGRSIAFTSDANGRWSSQWMRWSRIQEFWSDLVESAKPKSGGEQANIPFDMRAWVEGGNLVVDLSLFSEIGAKVVRGSVRTPRGETRELSYTRVNPGHYQARLENAMAGTYRATTSIGEASLPEVAWTLSGELFGEQSRRKPNLSLLNELAEQTGGKVDPTADDIRPLLKQVSDTTNHAEFFLALALVLFFVEVSIRAFQIPTLGRPPGSYSPS